VEVGSDDLPIACGYTTPTSGGAAFVKFDSAGSVVWQNLDADGIQNLLLHSQLLLDNRNNAYLAAGTLFQMAVCKVNHDGSNGWLHLGSGNTASAIALGPAGCIYATGIETVQLGQAHQSLPAILKPMMINGRPGVTVTGEIGQTYQLEASDDLATWTPLATAKLMTNRRECTDPDTAGKRSRFYRLAPAN
jgi:hypothetical protein